jgi:hypothetical protein
MQKYGVPLNASDPLQAIQIARALKRSTKP